MTLRLIRAAAAFAIALLTSAAHAWGPDGHHTVGAIADRLVAGTNAQAHQKNEWTELPLLEGGRDILRRWLDKVAQGVA